MSVIKAEYFQPKIDNPQSEADFDKVYFETSADQVIGLDDELANYLPLSGGNVTDTLTVKEKEVERVNSSDTNYIRYESGLQICWGSISGDQGVVNIQTFPASFSSIPTVIVCGNMGSNTDTYSVDNSRIATLRSTTTTQFKWQVSSPTSNSGTTVRYVAFGQWK